MAEENEDGQEKTHDPTEKKLQQARERGQVPQSQEVSTLFVYIGVAILVFGFGKSVVVGIFNVFISIMSKAGTIVGPSGGQGLSPHVNAFLSDLGLQLLPVAAVFFAVALLPPVLQNTIVISPERIKPKLNKISPKQGVKKIIGVKNLVEFAKGMVIMATITLTVWLILASYFPYAKMLVRSPFAAAVDQMGDALGYLILGIIFVSTIVAVIDIFFQRFEHNRQLRMSHKEVKDEQKQTEGDPEVKKRLQQLRAEKAQSRMMQDVSEADVVVANPTHYAVALKYQKDQDAAPKCVAKGVDEIARRIREVADEHNVPIVERPALARALYDVIEIDQEIPQNFYRIIAAVLAYVGAVETRHTVIDPPGDTDPREE